MNLEFYKGKKVLVTGHTGFKGTWLTRILVNAEAKVCGYSLEAVTEPSLFEVADIEDKIEHVIGDIRDLQHLKRTFERFQPEIVFHLAAQPIVRDGYKNPVYTYETNVIGTVNVCECIRNNSCVKSVINVTTDKVYHNKEWCWGYREEEELKGNDPYSNSKSCSELVTYAYKNSFWEDRNISVSTVRAGNVIGGGDFANDRIIPDCVRAVKAKKIIGVRNPNSIRPYQHVLEPLMAYLSIAAKQYNDRRYEGCYNIGPDESDCITTGELVELFCEYWGEDAKWENKVEENAPHEAKYLKLDCSKLKEVFEWKSHWHIEKCVEMVCKFSKVWLMNGNIPLEMDREIREFMEEE